VVFSVRFLVPSEQLLLVDSLTINTCASIYLYLTGQLEVVCEVHVNGMIN
jgi:hypothetical protein